MLSAALNMRFQPPELPSVLDDQETPTPLPDAVEGVVDTEEVEATAPTETPNETPAEEEIEVEAAPAPEPEAQPEARPIPSQSPRRQQRLRPVPFVTGLFMVGGAAGASALSYANWFAAKKISDRTAELTELGDKYKDIVDSAEEAEELRRGLAEVETGFRNNALGFGILGGVLLLGGVTLIVVSTTPRRQIRAEPLRPTTNMRTQGLQAGFRF